MDKIPEYHTIKLLNSDDVELYFNTEDECLVIKQCENSLLIDFDDFIDFIHGFANTINYKNN